MNAPSDIKKAIINNLISRAKLISSKIIFYKEVENIKQALINNAFSNYIVDEKIKCMIKILLWTWNPNLIELIMKPELMY